MSNLPCILATKKLMVSQKRQLQNCKVDDFNFINIHQNKNFQVSFPIKNAIFTSKNAAKALLSVYEKEEMQIDNSYCVGEKTANFLQKQGLKVVNYQDTAKDLARAICEAKTIKKVYFFCGNLRRKDLFDILNENHIEIVEKEVYKTKLTPIETTKKYDGILFFSPSAIQSYLLKNKNTKSVAFCIGTTTAATAVNYFETVFTVEKPTIENVLNFVNQYYE